MSTEPRLAGQLDPSAVNTVRETVDRVRTQIERVIVGKRA